MIRAAYSTAGKISYWSRSRLGRLLVEEPKNHQHITIKNSLRLSISKSPRDGDFRSYKSENLYRYTLSFPELNTHRCKYEWAQEVVTKFYDKDSFPMCSYSGVNANDAKMSSAYFFSPKKMEDCRNA